LQSPSEGRTKQHLSSEQVAYLDMIRMAAAELVLLHHGLLYFSPNPRKYLGDLGVVVFFLISGFLIGRSVFTNVTRSGYGFSTYMIDRFARIYTAYVPALILVAIIDYFLLNIPAFPDRTTYTLRNAVGNLLMLQQFPIFELQNHFENHGWFIDNFSSGHAFWTLPIEWWIYVTFGLLFFMIKDRSWTAFRVIILAVAAISPLYHFIARFSGSLTGAWMIGLGSSALYYWGESARIEMSRDRRWMLPMALVLTLLVIPMGLARLAYFGPYDMPFAVLLAVMLFAPLFILKFHPIRVPELLQVSAHHLASYSYSLYLIHGTLVIAIWTLHPEWVSGPFKFVLMLVGINVVAFCFAHSFELHYHKIADRLKALKNYPYAQRESLRRWWEYVR
jgi:peptidoglycan/LPS O-acetylase OafA/YrhL